MTNTEVARGEPFDIADAPRPWMHIFTDGAFDVWTGSAVWAWLAYDEAGNEMEAHSGTLAVESQARGSTEAECSAFDRAIAWASENGYHAVVSTDCQYVIKHAHETGTTRRRRFPRVHVQQVSRERVIGAHKMCRAELMKAKRARGLFVPAVSEAILAS